MLSRDMVVRAASVYLLAARRAGDAGQYRRALEDPDHRVRIEAVRALVSVDDVAGIVAATGDESREVRIAAAAGLATLRGGADAVRALVADPDPLVRAAALSLTRWAGEPAARDALGIALKDSDADVRAYARRALEDAE